MKEWTVEEKRKIEKRNRNQDRTFKCLSCSNRFIITRPRHNVGFTLLSVDSKLGSFATKKLLAYTLERARLSSSFNVSFAWLNDLTVENNLANCMKPSRRNLQKVKSTTWVPTKKINKDSGRLQHRAVAYDTRGLMFKSSHQVLLSCGVRSKHRIFFSKNGFPAIALKLTKLFSNLLASTYLRQTPWVGIAS